MSKQDDLESSLLPVILPQHEDAKPEVCRSRLLGLYIVTLRTEHWTGALGPKRHGQVSSTLVVSPLAFASSSQFMDALFPFAEVGCQICF